MPTKLWVPILLVAALAIAIFLGSRTGGEITDDAQFGAELKALQDDAVPILQSVDEQGGEPTVEQKKQLEAFHPRLERLLRYKQDSIAASFLAGKVNHILRNNLTAEKWLQVSLNSSKPFRSDPDVANTALEAHRLLSELYLREQSYLRAYLEADLAVKGHPSSPEYRLARASALVQLRRIPEARKDLLQALRFDPENTRAKGLLDFIGRSR